MQCHVLMLILAIAENELTPVTFKEGDLDDQNLDDWLDQRGCFTPPSDSTLEVQESSVDC